MINKIIIGGHGIGDCVLAYQCAKTAHDICGENIALGLSTRDEVYKAVTSFLGFPKNSGIKYIMRLDEKLSSEHEILNNWEYHTEIIRNKVDAIYTSKKIEDCYYVIPDLLFRNPHSFPYEKYNTNPNIIKQQRLLIGSYKPEKRIYCGLQTTTNGYLYQNIKQLLILLKKKLPDYEIYFPNCSTWNNDKCFHLPHIDGINIHENPDLIDSLDRLKTSAYFIGTCNGPSHLAYQCGIPRLILDPQFNKIPWISRWKEDYNECVPIAITPELASEIVVENILYPQTQMIPRLLQCQSDKNYSWAQKLIFKY